MFYDCVYKYNLYNLTICLLTFKYDFYDQNCVTIRGTNLLPISYGISTVVIKDKQFFNLVKKIPIAYSKV